LTIASDSCGDPTIPGRLEKEPNISEFNDVRNADSLAMCWLTDGNKPARTGLWNRTKVRSLAAGMISHQDGDAEGILTFNPADPAQAKLAIRSVKAKAKRGMTPERRAALSEALVKARKACQEGLIWGLESLAGPESEIRHSKEPGYQINPAPRLPASPG
jgi:hypothetical protein